MSKTRHICCHLKVILYDFIDLINAAGGKHFIKLRQIKRFLVNEVCENDQITFYGMVTPPKKQRYKETSLLFVIRFLLSVSVTSQALRNFFTLADLPCFC